MSQIEVIEEEEVDMDVDVDVDVEIDEEEEVQEEEEEMEVKVKKGGKKEKKNVEDGGEVKKEKKKRGPPGKRRPPTNRFQKIPNYDTHLRRSRKSHGEEGEGPKKKRHKLRTGTKAGRESRYLQEVATSGTFFSIQPVKRVIRQALSECAQELQVSADEWKQLSETTGKKYSTPLNKGVDKWYISTEAVQKVVAGAQRYLDKHAEFSHDIHETRKSVTVTGEDVALAHKFISSI